MGKAETMRKRYGEDYFSRIGAKGGKSSDKTKRTFYKNRDLASEAGRKGGLAKRRKI